MPEAKWYRQNGEAERKRRQRSLINKYEKTKKEAGPAVS
jgi:hypothetical protein